MHGKVLGEAGQRLQGNGAKTAGRWDEDCGEAGLWSNPPECHSNARMVKGRGTHGMLME